MHGGNNAEIFGESSRGIYLLLSDVHVCSYLGYYLFDHNSHWSEEPDIFNYSSFKCKHFNLAFTQHLPYFSSTAKHSLDELSCLFFLPLREDADISVSLNNP